MTAPVFPLAPRDVTVEMFALGGWIDIFPDVQVADGADITITRGRPNESGDPAAQACSLRLNNRSGKYSPKNPMSPYYGPNGLGRNTPLRVAVRTAKDDFARTVSNGWGTAPVGGPWSFAVAGGGSAADFAVSGGVATHTVGSTLSYRLSWLGTQAYHDVEVAVTVSLSATNITGDNVEPANLIIGRLSGTDYFLAVVKITPAETITIAITHVDGTVVVPDTTVPGLTFTGQALRVKFQRDAQNLRAKVWAAGSAEPYGWTVDGRSDKLIRRAPGWVGVRSGVAPGNTNVPVVFSYTNFEVRVPRFFGEVSKWPPKWDPSGKNVWTTITASGIRRRLGQGQTPLKSTYLRGNQTITPPHVAYYPIEELSDAKQIASGIGGGPMLVSGGSSQFASDSSFPGSAPIGKPNGARWFGPMLYGVPATGELQLMFLLSVPQGGENDQGTFAQITMTGTAGYLDVYYIAATGGVRFNFYDQGRNLIHTSGTMAVGVLPGQPLLASVQLTQSGSDIAYEFAWWVVGASGAFVSGGTVPGRTIGAPARIIIDPYAQIGSSAIGHVALRNDITSIFTLGDQFTAYAGETSGTRVGRLCDENGIPIQDSRNPVLGSALCGVQDRANLTDLLDEAIAADMGSLYESRAVLGLWRRSRNSLYNQPTVLDLNYETSGHVAPPFAPVEDDQFTRNDVTVTRKNGSSYEVIQATGPMAVTSPADGAGVGRYDDAVTLNLATDTQTPDAAAWLVHLGTVDEARYAQLTVDLAALARVDAARALAALAVNLDDRITVANPKLEISPDTLSLLARGYTERIGVYKHQLVFNCAPESPYQVLQFDGAGAKWDSGDSVLAAAATSTATTLVVASPSGQQWTTNPAAMPIALKVGGELVSATAVANENLSNTTFESGLAPWTASALSSFTQSGTQKHSGSFAARLVPNGVAASVGMVSEFLPVVAGQSVAVSGWAWFTSAVTNNFGLAVNWFTAAGAYISTSLVSSSAAAATWTLFAGAYTAPTGAVQAQLIPVLSGTPAAGQVFYVDDVSFLGPQRFTVTRSLNRVIKAQTAGTAIGLARPATLGL